MHQIDTRPIVAYIAYGPFGIEYLKKFLEKYLHFNSGAEHDLLICYKGFQEYEETINWRTLVKVKNIEFFEKNEKNDFDIGSYFRIAEKFKNRYILFLDTHTKPNCDDWLKIFLNHYNGKRLIGATGSFASLPSQFLKFYYKQHTKFQQLRWGLKHLARVRLFPNPHLRTTGFFMKGSDLIQLNFNREKFVKKLETNYFEGGRNSLTIQLQKKGFEIGIVNSDNNFYKIKDWNKSETFCCGNQKKLIFVDNRTDEYEKSSDSLKDKMRKFTWGN